MDWTPIICVLITAILPFLLKEVAAYYKKKRKLDKKNLRQRKRKQNRYKNDEVKTIERDYNGKYKIRTKDNEQ